MGRLGRKQRACHLVKYQQVRYELYCHQSDILELPRV